MKKMGLLIPIVALTGCFTLYETECPSATISVAPQGKDVTVRVEGFAANVTDYVAIQGYSTVLGGGGWYRDAWGRTWGAPMEMRTVRTETYVPQTHATDQFLNRAVNAFEEHGFVLKATKPDWLVQVEFSPAQWNSEDETVRALWLLCSVLSCDYGVETRTAKLKIYDNKTGKLVHHREFDIRYQVTMWSPFPIFGPASYDRTSQSYKQCWCLKVLTDLAVSDATAWLAKQSH